MIKACLEGDRMTYKLNPELRLIKAPVILAIGDQEQNYPDGESLLELKFDKNYLVHEITTRDNAVVVTLKENDQVGVINWIGEEAVSFM